ncbi:MAG: hypothetical protein AAGA23_18340 [Pseudomonadota bacterium]
MRSAAARPVLFSCYVFALALAGQPGQSFAEGEGQPTNDDRQQSGRLIAFTTPVGSAELDLSRLSPYRARWNSPGNEIEERLELDENGNWRHTQATFQVADKRRVQIAKEVRVLSGADLQSRYWSREFVIDSPKIPFRKSEISLNGLEMKGTRTALDGQEPKIAFDLPMPAFDGWIVGLAIATLPLETGYWASLPTVTHTFEGIHHLTVRVIDRATIEAGNGEPAESWVVEAEWVDLGSGDIYPPGAAETGGVYHLAVNPGNGVPPVIKYEAQSNPILWDGIRSQPD